VRVDVLLTPRVYDFGRDGIDLALRVTTTKLKDSPLVARKVGTVDFQLFAAPSYIARRGLPRSPTDFAAFDWVGLRNVALGFQDDGIRDRARILCDDMFFLRDTVRRGAGIGACPPRRRASSTRSDSAISTEPISRASRSAPERRDDPMLACATASPSEVRAFCGPRREG
jgi:DNA-binding transcriptional LysR family regulator